jgi:dihydroorotate dehydrogenase (NAD+) catalytic subunit
VLGVGGASTAEDVLEFVCAGAAAVQLGTAAFVDPAVLVRTVDDLERLLREAGTTVRELCGSMHRTAGGPARAAAGCAEVRP